VCRFERSSFKQGSEQQDFDFIFQWRLMQKKITFHAGGDRIGKLSAMTVVGVGGM